MVQFKEGVKLRVTKAVYEILTAAEAVFTRFSVPVVVTSGTDGQHSKQSKHYSGEALDLRISHLEPESIQPIVKGLKELLGKHFDIVLEVDHIHIEYDPKV